MSCQTDAINPAHYQREGVGFECNELASLYGFNTGNIVKYVWRYRAKNGVEDLRKARWYANAIQDVDLEAGGYPVGTNTHEMLYRLESVAADPQEWLVWHALRMKDLELLRYALDRLVEQEEAR